MTNSYAICSFPFNSAQVSAGGDIFFCCPPWSNMYSIGNIFEQPFEEIWNGEKAKEFRRQFINNDFKYCNLNLCVKDCNQKITPAQTVPFPTTFLFCYDSFCNVKCVFCRDCHEKQNLTYFDEHLDEILQSMLRNAEHVCLSGVGECLASKHSRKLLKRISELFPEIKISIISNGVLCDEKNLIETGIIDKLDTITVSMHAVTKKTYDKLVVGGNFDRVSENLKFISSLKKSGKINRFVLNFVVNSLNFKEMPSYVKKAEQLNASVGFLELLELNTNKKVFKELNVFDENHPDYNDFVKVLQNPIFRSDVCTINDCMMNLKPISFVRSLKNKTRRFFNR